MVEPVLDLDYEYLFVITLLEEPGGNPLDDRDEI